MVSVDDRGCPYHYCWFDSLFSWSVGIICPTLCADPALWFSFFTLYIPWASLLGDKKKTEVKLLPEIERRICDKIIFEWETERRGVKKEEAEIEKGTLLWGLVITPVVTHFIPSIGYKFLLSFYVLLCDLYPKLSYTEKWIEWYFDSSLYSFGWRLCSILKPTSGIWTLSPYLYSLLSSCKHFINSGLSVYICDFGLCPFCCFNFKHKISIMPLLMLFWYNPSNPCT